MTSYSEMSGGVMVQVVSCTACGVYLGVNYPSDFCDHHQPTKKESVMTDAKPHAPKNSCEARKLTDKHTISLHGQKVKVDRVTALSDDRVQINGHLALHNSTTIVESVPADRQFVTH